MKSVLDPTFSSVMLMHTDPKATFERVMRTRQETGELDTGAIASRSARAFREEKLKQRSAKKVIESRTSTRRAAKRIS